MNIAPIIALLVICAIRGAAVFSEALLYKEATGLKTLTQKTIYTTHCFILMGYLWWVLSCIVWLFNGQPVEWWPVALSLLLALEMVVRDIK